MSESENEEILVDIPFCALKPGDVVAFAGLRDKVLRIIMPIPPAVVAEVKCERHGEPTFWFAGVASIQTVVRQAEETKAIAENSAESEK